MGDFIVPNVFIFVSNSGSSSSLSGRYTFFPADMTTVITCDSVQAVAGEGVVINWAFYLLF